METLFLYILKSSGLIALFYIAYYLLLRKETFFTSNRWFLLAGLFTSALLPTLFYTTIVWVEPTVTNIDWSKIPHTPTVQEQSFQINWYIVIIAAYSLGLLLFLIQFAFDFYSLNRVLKGKKIHQQADHKFIDLKENVAPFSYFNTIVYNSTLYTQSELENILEHEKVHSEQYHTIDVLITRFFCILFWFNPLIWLYKKAILQNLEFIADSVATKNLSDKKAYQLTLLKITTHENCVALTNHFYQSLIKKRIVMLNKNQSKKSNSWKYALIIPVLIAFAFIFQIKVLAQEKKTVTTSQTATEDIILVINKNTTDAKIQQETQLLKDAHGINLKVSKIKRNPNQEITSIKLQFDDKNGNKGTNQVDSDKPISPITFIKNVDTNGKVSIGFYTGKPHEKVNKRITVVSKNDDESNYSFSFSGEDDKSEVTEVEEIDPISPLDPLDEIEKNENKNIIITRSKKNEKPTIYINGKKIDIDSESMLAELDPSIMEQMNDIRGNITIEKNGEDGENHVFVFKSKDGKTVYDMNTHIEKTRAEMMKAFKDRKNMQPEMERAIKEMEKSKIEMQKAKAEMEKARIELEKAKEETRKKQK